jgi:hypothetical protein
MNTITEGAIDDTLESELCKETTPADHDACSGPNTASRNAANCRRWLLLFQRNQI